MPSKKKASGTEDARKWSDETAEVQDALWLRLRVDAIVKQLRAATSDTERARLAAVVRSAANAISGVDPAFMRDRMTILIKAINVVTRDAHHVTNETDTPSRRARTLASMLRLSVNEIAPAIALSDQEIAKAVETWRQRGAKKWTPFARLARAVGAASKDTDDKSIVETVNRIAKSRPDLDPADQS
ncbi:MAG: hypothetical protein NVS3B10_30450 [Polyangiales bacterium]